MLTAVTQMFGVRGSAGDMEIEPKLLACQFDAQAAAELSLRFAGIRWQIRMENKERLDAGAYGIDTVQVDEDDVISVHDGRAILPVKYLSGFDGRRTHRIRVVLCRRSAK